MKKAGTLPLSEKIIAWIARLWSVLVSAVLLLVIFFSDPGGVGSSKSEDIIMFALTVLTLLGLFIAWRRTQFGSLFTLAMLFI